MSADKVCLAFGTVRCLLALGRSLFIYLSVYLSVSVVRRRWTFGAVGAASRGKEWAKWSVLRAVWRARNCPRG